MKRGDRDDQIKRDVKDSKIKEHKLLGKPGLWDSYYMQICIHVYTYMGFPGSSAGKESACNAETWVRSLGWEDPLEKEMATHSRILAWRISMDRGAWQATVHGVTESDVTE